MEESKNIRCKPIAKPITGNCNNRFDPIYRCYCPNCGTVLKRSKDECDCGQLIDWSEWQ